MITEVGLDAVEIYLAEPRDKSMSLEGHVLRYRNSDGQEGEVPLVGTMRGGEWLVIWADPNYSGPPTPARYTNFHNNQVAGLAVNKDFFQNQSASSWAFRVSGEKTLYFLFIPAAYHRSDNTVNFGPQPRPALGGAFRKDGSLNNAMREPRSGIRAARTVSRKSQVQNSVPVGYISTGAESDWRVASETFGNFTSP